MFDDSRALSDRVQDAVQEYSPSIIRLAYTFTKNLPDAEDIAQDVFLTYLIEQPNLENKEHEKAWLLRVTMNKSKDLVGSGWFKRRAPLSENLGYHPNTDQIGSDLLQVVLKLEKKYRIPIHLYYYEDYSIKEIAKMLKVRPSTVATWVDRGRALIKKKLGVTLDE